MFRNNNPISGIDQLTHKLKQEDERYSRLSKGLQIVYWVLAPVYLIMILRHATEGSSFNDTISGVFFLVAMVIFALFFRNYYKEYKNVDYSLPTLIVLKKAAYRYQPFQLKTIWILMAIICINVGLSLKAVDHTDLFWIQITFWGLMLISIGIGLVYWYFRYKPLRDAALKMIKEIEEQ
jgi:predicted benzoate:H+ symporter BenE